jgi:hypothetical protein
MDSPSALQTHFWTINITQCYVAHAAIFRGGPMSSRLHLSVVILIHWCSENSFTHIQHFIIFNLKYSKLRLHLSMVILTF